jgi:hypothetical protein
MTLRRIKPGKYLIGNIPRIQRAEIKGIKVARPSRMEYEYSQGYIVIAPLRGMPP